MNLYIKACAASALILLAGCYQTDSPLLEKGEKTALTGQFQCKNNISGKTDKTTFTEKREGFWPFASYRYSNQEGKDQLLKKLPSGLYLDQMKEAASQYNYVFVDFIDSNQFLILAADLMGKREYIDSLLKKYKLEAKSTKEMFVTLKGDKTKLQQFFDAHDKTLMTVIIKCERA